MSEYSITVESPTRPRRGSTRLLVVVKDSQGTEIFRDRADINEEKSRTKVAERIAQLTGDTADDINLRLLQGLGNLQPPGNAGTGASLAPGPGGQMPPYPYEATPGGIIWNKETPEGIFPVPLTTFTALITGQVAEDDGAETHRWLEIEAILRGRDYHFRVLSGQFSGMAWPMEHVGAAAAFWAGLSIKDHARAAIQFLSGDPPERRVYAHLGWRKIGGSWCYLHAGGAIGPVGPVPEVDVSLSSDLELYRLPDPPYGPELRDALRASLRLLYVAGETSVFPLYCAIWRAPLGGCDSAQHLVGQTGSGKSELAARAQQHYGAGLDARHLPGNWSSTDNALEILCFTVKDALVVVDDFCPTGRQSDVQAKQRSADRLFRAQGNTSGRQRLSRDSTLRPARPPRGMLLSTGEDVPMGQSLQARVLISEVPKFGSDALDWDRLTECQKDAADGLYAQAMSGYIRWLAAQYDEVQAGLPAKISALRERAYQSGQHRRTPDIVANLAVGFEYFLEFAASVGAIDDTERQALWERCWQALGRAAEAQGEHQQSQEPAQRFLELVTAAVSSGRCHVASLQGSAPSSSPEAWGWRRNDGLSGPAWSPQGRQVGWVDGNDLYLESDAAFAEAQLLAENSGGSIPVSLPTLRKRLHERGELRSTGSRGGKDRFEIRRTIQGKRRSVLHLHSQALYPQEVAQVAQVAQFDSPQAQIMAVDGPPIGPLDVVLAGEVAQESVPLWRLPEADGIPGGPPGPLGPPSQHIPPADEEFVELQSQLPWADFAKKEGISSDDVS
jgi:hypothetical protein